MYPTDLSKSQNNVPVHLKLSWCDYQLSDQQSIGPSISHLYLVHVRVNLFKVLYRPSYYMDQNERSD